MGFFDLSDGTSATGNAEKAHASGSMLIPNNTKALAEIKGFELVQLPSGDKFYEVKWSLKTTSYKGIYVQQKLKVFDTKKVSSADRAKEMMMRILSLANYQFNHNGQPSDEELAKLKGRTLGINILQWFYDGKKGNWVNEVHPQEGFDSKDGVFIDEPTNAKPSASPSTLQTYDDFMRNSQGQSLKDDPLPF